MKLFTYEDGVFWCNKERNDYHEIKANLVCNFAKVNCYLGNGLVEDVEIINYNPFRVFLKCSCGVEEEITDDIKITFENGYGQFKIK